MACENTNRSCVQCAPISSNNHEVVALPPWKGCRKADSFPCKYVEHIYSQNEILMIEIQPINS